jgi:hypothetical protein
MGTYIKVHATKKREQTSKGTTQDTENRKSNLTGKGNHQDGGKK